MKAIHALPLSIREIFSKTYRIPSFQRPYSWTTLECQQLWDDIVSFYNQDNADEEYYFLGNIVVHPSKDGNKDLSVIDGQQRLTTLLLLLKVLYENAGTFNTLNECLKRKDRLTNEIKDELRLVTEVNEGDKKELEDIILDKGNSIKASSNFGNNYKNLAELFQAWRKDIGNDSEKLNKLILIILDKIVLLPINCESQDHALTIFETINNRGLGLSDSDILKSKLYKMAESDGRKGDFITSWEKLSYRVGEYIDAYPNKDQHESDFITGLFRDYMYILRAEYKDITKTVKLRDFFSGRVLNYQKKQIENNKYKIENMSWENVIKHIIKILEIRFCIKEFKGKTSSWLDLISRSVVELMMPVIIFLFRNIDDASEYVFLEKSKMKFFIRNLENISRYYFAKKLYPDLEGSTTVDEIYKMNRDIYHNSIYKHGIIRVKQEFKILLNGKLRQSHRRILTSLLAITSTNQVNFDGNFQVEHILPKKWNNNYYDIWNNKIVDEVMDTIGNLVLLERIQNIKGSNKFFDKKKELYRDSNNSEANDLLSICQWTYAEYEKRQNNCVSRLKDFFENRL